MSRPAPLARPLRWCGWLALAGLLLLPLSVAAAHSGLAHQALGLAVFAAGCLLSLLALLALAIASLLPRQRGRRVATLWRALPGLPGALLAGALLGAGAGHPPIHDVATDTGDPPQFSMAPRERGARANPLAIEPEAIAAQLRAYPDLATIHSELELEPAMRRAAEVAGGLGWRIYAAHQASGCLRWDVDVASGRWRGPFEAKRGLIEASATSFWFGFVDDVAIRFTATGAGTAIDLRSVSRVGRGDLGANARRIRAFERAWRRAG